MTTTASLNLRMDEYVYTPPALPTHISSAYGLKAIVGCPTDEDVKAIHAAIGAVDAGARTVGDGVMGSYSWWRTGAGGWSGVPDTGDIGIIAQQDNTYMPPALPAHIPILLEPVVGAPSMEQLRAAHDAMKVSESLGSGPLSDPDLNMQLSQHLFNLQLAQYAHDSTLGQFAPKLEESGQVLREPQVVPSRSHENTVIRPPPEPVQTGVPDTGMPRSSATESACRECRCSNLPSSGTTEQREIMKEIKELMRESKGVLEKMSRVLIAIQRNQVIVGEWTNHNYAHVNPVNEQGLTAAECGLPQLRFSYHKGSYWTHLSDVNLARYFKFFDIGAHLLEGDEIPQIKDGKQSEAKTLLFKHMGFIY